ncbi:MAG: family 1 glycosylhydrolase [Solobacterium sp.]|jgi:beta-glucosidase|nr:family 1 glycosylhydrolase [Solobacterium sp.]
MAKFKKEFLLGAATAAHQVEGNNIHSDYWVQENLPHSQFVEPSGLAVDHYNRYAEDIQLMKKAGLNAYRFSIEWARIEPEEGHFDEKEVQHYLDVIHCCKENGLEPVVTLMHFTSPAWLIRKGGWENPSVVESFRTYTSYIISKIGREVNYVCTINEANMRLQLAALIRSMMARMMAQASDSSKEESKVQMGINLKANMQMAAMESAKAFGLEDPRKVAVFVSGCTAEGDELVMKAHRAAVEEIKKQFPEIKVGLTLSLHDIQYVEGGKEKADAAWNDEFLHYLPYFKNDDFLGVQGYSRNVFDANGETKPKDYHGATQMGYEYYPETIGHIVRRAAEDYHGTILVTENGIATADDKQRIAYLDQATSDIQACIKDGIDVRGYFCWSLLDNFEWQKGFAMQFGLIAVDRQNSCNRTPKESLSFLGSLVEHA